MGQSNQQSKIKIDNPNDYFLSLTANPQSNSMLAQVNVINMSTFNKWNNSVDRIKAEGPTNMLIPRHSKIIERPMCGQNFKLQIEYPCYHILLSKQIDKRQQVDKYLQEAQMWYLVYCLAESAHSCHRLGRPIGDVRPQNLLLNKEGNLKILSNVSVPLSTNVLQAQTSKSKSFASPQQLQSIKKSYKQSHLDYIQSQSFAIGMTVLSAGILQDLTKCYHYLINQINMLEFNKATNFWLQNVFYSQRVKKNIEYSKQLKNIVMNLVQINPERRMTSLEVYQILSEYKEDIMKLQPFSINIQRWSPRKKQQNSTISANETIHILRSRKKSQKSSPKKQEKIQVSNFNPNESSFQSYSPNRIQSLNNSANKQLSPTTRKKKINTSMQRSNNKETEHK